MSLIPIDTISVSRIAHPSDRFCPGQDIFAVVRGRDPSGRITLSHKELLGSGENAEQFSPGETVQGIVRSVESYASLWSSAPTLRVWLEPKPGVRPDSRPAFT